MRQAPQPLPGIAPRDGRRVWPGLLAVALSLALHALLLWAPQLADWLPAIPGLTAAPVVVRGELRRPPSVLAAPPAAANRPQANSPRSTPVLGKKARPLGQQLTAGEPSVVESPPSLADALPALTPPALAEVADAPPEPPVSVTESATPSALPLWSAQGYVRYQVRKYPLGWVIGWVEQRWSFPGDGRYQLLSRSETSGLAALLKPVRVELLSQGRLTAGGLQPWQFRLRKNGQDSGENADFDWQAAVVSGLRGGQTFALDPGAQDLLSFNFQLAFLGPAAAGHVLGVVTGRKYERHRLQVLGEEVLELPLGRFRCLRLLAESESRSEIWIALDHGHLPVKIRFTDKKGESFEQIASDLGSGDPPLSDQNTGTP